MVTININKINSLGDILYLISILFSLFQKTVETKIKKLILHTPREKNNLLLKAIFLLHS